MDNEADQLQSQARWAIRAEVRRYLLIIGAPLGALAVLASGFGSWLATDSAAKQAESNFIKENYQGAFDAAMQASIAIEDARKLLGEAKELKATAEGVVQIAQETAAATARSYLKEYVESRGLSWKDVTASTNMFDPKCLYRARMHAPAETQDLRSLMSDMPLDDASMLFSIVVPGAVANTIGNANDVGLVSVSNVKRNTIYVRSRSFQSERPIKALEEFCF